MIVCDSNAEVLIEHPVAMPVTNPEGGTSRSFIYRGKIDHAAVEPDGTAIVTDYKFVTDPQDYLDTERISYQRELYVAALEHQDGLRVVEWRFRLVTTPSLQIGKMKKYPTFEAFEQACQNRLREPGQLVEAEVPMNRARIEQAKWWLWENSKRVLDCRRNNRWLHNEHACRDWQRRCPYMPLCLAVACGSDYESAIDDKYEVVENTHPELPEAETNGKDVLTYSSMSTLARCEMCYQWRYERRLRKQRDHADALWLGSASHAGMEAFAKGGLEAAYAAINAWAEANPALGQEANKMEGQACKARAMVRAAGEQWSNTGATP